MNICSYFFKRKVYVVLLWSMNGIEDISGVFTSRKKAEKFLDNYPKPFDWVTRDDYEIQEIELK